MLKRRVDLSPEEKRVRRLRFSLYGVFAGFIVGILLAVAWFGAVGNRRNPPMILVPEREPDGTLVFELAPTLEAARGYFEGTESPERVDADLSLIRQALRREVQVVFWKQPDDRTEWLAFLPLHRPQLLFSKRLRDLLAELDMLLPHDSTEEEPPIGYYTLTGKGLFVGSARELPAFTLEEGVPELGSTAHYNGPTGFIPAYARGLFPVDPMSFAPSAGPSSAEIIWQAPNEDREGEVKLLLVYPSESSRPADSLSYDYFDPIFPDALEAEEGEPAR